MAALPILGDLANGLGWLVIGVIAYVLLVTIAEAIYDLWRGGYAAYERREVERFYEEVRRWEAQQRRRREAIGVRDRSRRGPYAVGDERRVA